MYSETPLQQCLLPSPLGLMKAVGEGDALHGLWFVGQKHYPAEIDALEQAADAAPFVVATREWLAAYFAGDRPTFAGRLVMAGGAFYRAVWDELLTVSYGHTLSYAALAQQVAQRLGRLTPAVRATASAVGHNPFTIIVPCHRIVGSDGRLHGYAGGVERKVALLRLEGTML